MTIKTGIITQARINSSRLPKKTLLEINGISLLEYHLRRLLESRVPVYIATTSELESYKLISIAKKMKVSSIIGSLDDVLSRFYIAAKSNNLEVIIRVTSDCPLVDGAIISDAVTKYFEDPNWENTYFSNTQIRLFPRGMDFEIFSFKLLEEAYLNGLKMNEREHVTPFMYTNPKSSAHIKHYSNSKFLSDNSNLRLTVDTELDFKLIEKLICIFNADKKSIQEIIEIMTNHPELHLINQTVEQKKI